jgi:integration host factor subunit alpha
VINKATLTKNEISKNLSIKTGFPKTLSKEIIDSLIDILIENINPNGIKLKNIGSFKIIKKKERLGRNPKTKEQFIISSRNSISFTASKKLLNNL